MVMPLSKELGRSSGPESENLSYHAMIAKEGRPVQVEGFFFAVLDRLEFSTLVMRASRVSRVKAKSMAPMSEEGIAAIKSWPEGKLEMPRSQPTNSGSQHHNATIPAANATSHRADWYNSRQARTVMEKRERDRNEPMMKATFWLAQIPTFS
ncbi:hypothetical protein M413DRAFT_404892 [Hebeloma cylindrosporum]|uniref:Uncharacterized protein n=1 Tax=Hebeloma cylindrosporum TaxID=76867 RepID=A0A0C3CXM9_HEBCY|nr:hypothetical protein M413DRAFT_404892 [Hebeloma cylindrosporum h7]